VERRPNVIRAGSRLLASTSPDANYQLGIEMSVSGLISLVTHLTITPMPKRARR